jgi:hypothetical protein
MISPSQRPLPDNTQHTQNKHPCPPWDSKPWPRGHWERPLLWYKIYKYTGWFIRPSGISELDCATTKTDTAERSISIDRESLPSFFVLGAVAYLQILPLGGSRDETWRGQGIVSGLCLGICQNLTSVASPRLHISSTCKVGQKLGVSLHLLTFSPSAWPSRLLYRRGRKSRRDLWITLYII